MMKSLKKSILKIISNFCFKKKQELKERGPNLTNKKINDDEIEQKK